MSVEHLVSNARQVCAKWKKNIDLDSVHAALIEIDTTAHKHSHPKASYYSLVLSRFAIRKHDNDDEGVAMLISRLLGSLEEAKILKIEQMYMKHK